MKKIIGFLIVAILIGGIAAFSYFSSRTILNDENAVGNTAGNLLNGGLFCENEGKIYFSNHKDLNSLYVMDSDMTNYKKLYSDSCSYINATNKYIIYVRDNHTRETLPGQFFNFNTVGLFRLDKSTGKNIKQLYGKPAGFTSLKGNYVYYQHYNADEGLRFHKVKINAKEDIEISQEQIIPSSFIGNVLYYNGVDNDHDIHSMNLSNQAVSTVYSGNCYNITATNNFLYFLSLTNDYGIGRVSHNGENPQLVVEERCSFFNISSDEKYLYYQVDGGDNNRFCRMDLSTYESETLMEGDYNSIHVTENYVFFKQFGTEDVLYLNIATGSISPFQPEIIP